VNGSEYAALPCSVLVPVRGIYIGISDLVAVAMNIEAKVRSARYRIRDEPNRITWVHDRLQGLTPNAGHQTSSEAR
jgi:hypothetical protein